MSRGKMKKFKEYIKKSVDKKDPILITAEPVHGSHAKKRKTKKTPRVVKEESKVTMSKWLMQHDNHHLGPSHIDVDKKLHDHHWDEHGDYFKKAMHAYTEDSNEINKYLIAHASGKKITDNKYDRMDHETREKHVKNLDAHLNNPHNALKHDLHVYHGTTSWNPGHEAAKHPEGHIRIPTYVSTSIHKHVAHNFGTKDDYGEGDEMTESRRHVLHVHLKEGDPGKYIGNNTSVDRNEHEFLLPRNKVYKVHPKPTKLSDGTHVWHAEMLKDHK